MVDAATTSLITTTVTGLVVFTILYIFFELVRPRKPEIYQYRKLLGTKRPDLNDFNAEPVKYPKPPPKGFFAWFTATLRLTDDDLVSTVGMDGTMFLSFERMMIRIFLVAGVLSCLVLLPVYGTGNKVFPTDSIERLTMANRAPTDDQGDQFIWFAFAIDFAIVYFTLAMLYFEMQRYTRLRRKYTASENPANYTVVIYDIPADQWDDASIKEKIESAFPGEVDRVNIVYKCPKLQKKLNLRLQAIEKRERAEFNCAHAMGKRPIHKPGMCAPCKGTLLVDSIDYWREETDRLTKEIVEDQMEKDPKLVVKTYSAFVTFRSKSAATVAVQTQVFSTPLQWRIVRAGEPKAVHWSGLGVSSILSPILKINSVWWLIFFLVFWSAVTAFIMILANPADFLALIRDNLLAKDDVDGRQTVNDMIDGYKNLPSFILGVVEDILPVILVIVFGLLPKIIIKLMIKLERLPSLHLVETKQRNFLFTFSLFATFLYVVLSGTIVQMASEIIEKPASIIDALVEGIPVQATFFLNFIVGLCFIGFAVELSQIVRVVLHPVLAFIWKTDRQKRKILGMSAMFLYVSHYVPALVIGSIGFIYSTIAPLVALSALLYFSIGYIVHKHNIAYTMANPWQGGGMQFPGTIQCVLVALYIKTLTMTGMFSLNRLPGPAIVSLINLAGTVVFNIWLVKRYGRLSQHGALTEKFAGADKVGDSAVEGGGIQPSYAALYVNPALRELMEEPNLSGVGESDLGGGKSAGDAEQGMYASAEAPHLDGVESPTAGTPVHLQK